MNEKTPYNLLAKYFCGNITADEKVLVENWENESDRNKKEFQSYKMIWENSKEEKEISEFNADMALKKINEQLDVTIIKKLRPLFKYAAAIALLLVSSITFLLIRNNMIYAEQTYMTEAEVKEIILKDGSTIWLNEYSEVNVFKNFNIKERTVSLKGEAFFDISPDKEKPFYIHAFSSVIKVVGTSFNVKAKEKEEVIAVSVSEGIVLFSEQDNIDKNKIELIAGQKGMYSKEHKSFSKEKYNVNEIAWKTKKLVFDETTVDEVINVLNEFYNTNFQIIDTSVLSKTYKGEFDNLTKEEAIQILEYTLNTDINEIVTNN